MVVPTNIAFASATRTPLWATVSFVQNDPVAFFQTAVEHAMEGFYSDPGNGGNHDGVSWRMIGFEVRG